MNTEKAFWKDEIFLEHFNRSKRLKNEVYSEQIGMSSVSRKGHLLDVVASCGAFEIAYKLWRRNKIKQELLDTHKTDSLEFALKRSSYDTDSIERGIALIEGDTTSNSFVPGSKSDAAHKNLQKESLFRKMIPEGGVSLNTEQKEMLFFEQRECASSKEFSLFIQECVLKPISVCKTEKVKDLQLEMFNVIVDLINKPGKISRKNAFLISCLETGIKSYLPFLNKFLGEESYGLVFLRKSSDHKFNTVCYICQNKLLRKDDSSQCRQNENRKCYKDSLLSRRLSSKEARTFSSKNKCEKLSCGRHSSLDFIYKVRGVDHQFCSKRCYMAYRKALQRKKP